MNFRVLAIIAVVAVVGYALLSGSGGSVASSVTSNVRTYDGGYDAVGDRAGAGGILGMMFGPRPPHRWIDLNGYGHRETRP